MNRILTLVLLAIAIWFVGLSLLMAIAPDRIVSYVKGSAMWRRYLDWVFGIKADDIDSRELRIRMQGLLGLVFSAFLCVGVWELLKKLL